MNGNEFGRAAAAGLAGAAALTGVHQLALGVTDVAPRMDVLGMRALKESMESAGGEPPRGSALYRWTLAGDLISNSLYYSLVAGGRGNRWVRGTLLGLAAGVGALVLPRRLGLGDPPNSDYLSNQVMTVAWYLVGGLAAAAAATAIDRRRADRLEESVPLQDVAV